MKPLNPEEFLNGRLVLTTTRPRVNVSNSRCSGCCRRRGKRNGPINHQQQSGGIFCASTHNDSFRISAAASLSCLMHPKSIQIEPPKTSTSAGDYMTLRCYSNKTYIHHLPESSPLRYKSPRYGYYAPLCYRRDVFTIRSAPTVELTHHPSHR